MTLRVLIVSDVRLVQEGLSSILAGRSGVDVVCTADVSRARDESARLRPDVVLFDAARQGSVEHMRSIVASAPQCRVVAFGVQETGDEILALAAAGTAGYVRDSAASADVITVLERVMCDELVCSPRAAASLYRQVATLAQASGEPAASAIDDSACTPLLSRREVQIAQLVDRGLSNKEIARQLGIEATTVKNHVHNMCGKLKVHRRGQAAARIRTLLRSRVPLLRAVPWRKPVPLERLGALLKG
ncbi:MAG TPA: response regulator transcription factor [Steroidobacteraceae bacterium]|nr:response regulator transcription factor [Steroidobacteraceae bacterium]